MTKPEIVTFEVVGRRGGSKGQADLNGLPFGDLIEPDTAFAVTEGSKGGVDAALRRFCMSACNVQEFTPEAKALFGCYRVFDKTKDRDHIMVGLAAYRPDFPASKVMEIKAEREAEAAMMHAIERRSTVKGLRNAIATAEQKIAELEAEEAK